MMDIDIRSFWGKAQPCAESAILSHPVVAHVLDVAAVAMLLPRRGDGLDGRTLGFLVSLHDIGKFSRSFQAMAPAHWPAAVLGPLEGREPPAQPKHDALGLHLLRNKVGDLLDGVLPPGMRAWNDGARVQLFGALAGHHGRPVADPPLVSGLVLDDVCEASARAFVTAMLAVFDPPPLARPSKAAMLGLEWGLAGLTTLADWVGSRQAWFPYVEAAAVADPARYLFTQALPQAASALAAAGLARAAPAEFGGLRRLFPGIDLPSPIQAWAEHVPLPDGPVLAVVEDLTGSGKTEAAVTLAHRMIAEGRADGLYLALPTMATANAMFDRMADAYRRLFDAEARPSLALAHGRADLDPRFAPAMTGGPEPDRAPSPDAADEPAESHCTAWLADDRRRALLAHVGVGTIDQALLAVLPVRHATLRLYGLCGKVLVVDEAHAFDAYMERELVALLQAHAALGGSAILLSATLPQAVRARLVDAFRRGLGAPACALTERAYPLATIAGGSTIEERSCGIRIGSDRAVTVTRLPDTAAAVQRIVQAARGGAAVAWIRNTVDDVLAAAAMLREAGLDPLVFHARFAFCDRLAIETEVLRLFGRDSTGPGRGRVLVATQVIEQSLDLDFDLLCTDLAPVDRLIQRAGRLWRHQRTRPPVTPEPELFVVSPEPVAAPDARWIAGPMPGTAAVYRDPALLWRSARAIFSRPMLTVPDDMRPLIEEVADTGAPGAIPAALAPAANIAAGKHAAASGIAAQNVLTLKDGYRTDTGSWEPDTHTPTRLEDRPQVTLRLARLRDGEIVPYAPVTAGLRHAWALSEVTVAQARIAACPLPLALEAAAVRAKQAWGRWERESDRVILALLEEHEELFQLPAIDGKSHECVAGYGPIEGLSFLGQSANHLY